MLRRSGRLLWRGAVVTWKKWLRALAALALVQGAQALPRAARTDPRGKTTTYAYDSAGNMIQITSPLGRVTSMDYDVSGRMISMVKPRGNEPGATPADFTTAFTHDASDNLTQTDPLGNVTSFTHDAAGNPETRTDAKGRTTTWTYNAADELASVIAPDQSSTSYAYEDAPLRLAAPDDLSPPGASETDVLDRQCPGPGAHRVHTGGR